MDWRLEEATSELVLTMHEDTFELESICHTFKSGLKYDILLYLSGGEPHHIVLCAYIYHLPITIIIINDRKPVTVDERWGANEAAGLRYFRLVTSL